MNVSNEKEKKVNVAECLTELLCSEWSLRCGGE